MFEWGTIRKWTIFWVRNRTKTAISTLIKKKIKLSSYIKKFRMGQLQSHIWLTASSYMGKHLRISSCLTLQLLHFEFPYIWGKSYFLFYQCKAMKRTEVSKRSGEFYFLKGQPEDLTGLDVGRGWPVQVALADSRNMFHAESWARIFKLSWSPGIDSSRNQFRCSLWSPAGRYDNPIPIYSVPSPHNLFKNSSSALNPAQIKGTVWWYFQPFVFTNKFPPKYKKLEKSIVWSDSLQLPVQHPQDLARFLP